MLDFILTVVNEIGLFIGIVVGIHYFLKYDGIRSRYAIACDKLAYYEAKCCRCQYNTNQDRAEEDR